jgi:electron transfer flavoprotein beta subunit
MKIAVLVKRVADSESRIKVGGDGTAIDTAGVQYVINPYDEIAVEQALQLKAGAGGEVIIVCLGPKDAAKEVRKALAMTADSAVLLADEMPDRDSYGTAKVLADELKELAPDLILSGRISIDSQVGAVAPMVAQMLDMPLITEVSSINLEGETLTCERAFEGGKEVVEAKLPALVTVQKGLVEPRLPKLPDIMKAKKKPLTEKPAAEIAPKIKVLSMELPPPRAGGEIVGEGAEAAPALVKKLKDEAGVL